jgi:hypothetical protein
MLDSIGGEKVISFGTALWDGQGAVRVQAAGLQTTFVPNAGATGGPIRSTSNQGSLEVDVPTGAQAAVAGAGSQSTGGKHYRVSWAMERLGGLVRLTYTIVQL